MHKYFFRVLTGISLFFFCHCHSPKQMDEYYCNLMAGEPTQTSVILAARLHKTDTLVNNDLQGIKGYIKFRITRDNQSRNYMESPFYQANEKNDFTAKYEFTGLRPGQKYFYSISYGRDTSNNTTSPWSTFKTLNLPGSDKSVSFIITSGLNNQIFSNAEIYNSSHPTKFGSGNSGLSIFNTISSFKPDFWILNGEIESANASQKLLADTQKEWHNLFSIPEFSRMVKDIPSYWILTENVLAENPVFDQIPVPSGISENQLLQRTYRLNRDVQIWILGSLFLNSEDQGKRNDGDAQIKWLKSTLKESDSPFKLLISGSSFTSQDDSPGFENQNSSITFREERDSLFNWLKNNGFRNNGLYFICNKSENQYHIIDPAGFEEFACGELLNSENQVSGFKTDTISADPDVKPVEAYVQKDISGGFLIISSGRDEYSSPVLLFRFYDRSRKLLYAVNKF